MEVFFYGLFMDPDILLEKGVKPTNPRKGYLNNYTLKIGTRASLVPCKNEKAFGIMMTCEEDAIHSLYKEPEVADYIPEEVDVITDLKGAQKATCYNLPEKLLTGTNKTYAQSLFKLARKQDFPPSYLEKIIE